MTEDPEGKSAANIWRVIKKTGAAGDASLFLRHIDYLFSVDAPRFLDWLAHIEQRPGELPHTGMGAYLADAGDGTQLACIRSLPPVEGVRGREL